MASVQPLTSAEMQALEQAAIASGRVTGLALMERAGQGVVEAIFETWPDLEPVAGKETAYLEREEGQAAARRAVILCGPGNNGGDGFVVARLLVGCGWDVAVFFYGAAAMLPPDALTNFDRWCDLGDVARLSFPKVAHAEAGTLERALSAGNGAVCIVDALFGIGLNRPIEGLALVADLLEDCGSAGLRRACRVAIDVPSGLGEDGPVRGHTGHPDVLQSDLTVTFHAKKRAHLVSPDLCGKVVVKDIGL